MRKVFGNLLWLSFDKIFRMGVGVVLGVWTARYLGPVQFGTFNYVQAIVAVFVAVSALGMDQVVVKAILDSERQSQKILSNVFSLRLLVSTIFFVICCLLMYSESEFMLAVFLSSVLFFNPLLTIDIFYQSRIQSRYTVIAQNFAFFIISLLRVWLILTKADLVTFGLAFLLESALSGLILLYFYFRKSHQRLWIEFDMQTIKGIVRKSWPFIFSSLMIVIYMKIDQIMLGKMINDAEVGVYSSALRLSEVWYFIPVIISNSIYPILIQSKKDSPGLYQDRLQKLMNVLILISVPVSVLFTVLSGFIVTWLYGEAYVGAGAILSIHIWTSIFVFIGTGGGLYYLIEDLSKKVFIRSIAGALINVVLNLLLIPAFKGIGAAIATLIAQIFVTYLFDALSLKTMPLFIIKSKALACFDPLRMLAQKVTFR